MKYTNGSRSGRKGRKVAGFLAECLHTPRAFCVRFVFVCFVYFVLPQRMAAAEFAVLKPDTFSHYIANFNAMEDENVTNFISNADSWNWLQKEIPFFECPDREVEEMYYFRWWSFRKHLEQTTNGFVFTEFLTRPAPVSSALGHQIAEGRWLHDQNYLDDYVRYWLRDEKSRQQLHKYSNWLDDALWQRYLVTGDKTFVVRAARQFDERLPAVGTGTAHHQRPVLAIRRPRRDGRIHQRFAHEQKSAPDHQQLHVWQRAGHCGHRAARRETRKSPRSLTPRPRN